MPRLLNRAKLGAWLAILRVVGMFHPRAGTRLSIRFYRAQGMQFEGTPTFISSRAWFDGSENYGLITLREGCNISRDVRILTHDWSPYCTFRALGRSDSRRVGRLLPVVVGEHSFIGMGVLLMPGVTIGRGAVVGAGAVVRGHVPDYAIVIGNPSTVVGDARDYLKRKFPDEWTELPSSIREYRSS